MTQFRDFQSNGSLDLPIPSFYQQYSVQSIQELNVDLSTIPPEVVISLGDTDFRGTLLESMIMDKEITEKDACTVKDAIGAWLDSKCADEQVKLSPKAKEMLGNLLISISRRITDQTT